jgi:hypothetical protein
MSDRGPYNPEILSMMYSVLEQSVETLINGQVVDQATREGMRLGMTKICMVRPVSARVVTALTSLDARRRLK